VGCTTLTLFSLLLFILKLQEKCCVLIDGAGKGAARAPPRHSAAHVSLPSALRRAAGVSTSFGARVRLLCAKDL